VQFNSELLTKDENPKAKAYYDKLYRTRPGYYRLGPTWEIPQWIAEMQRNFPDADVLFADNVAQVLNKMHDYSHLAFSALDCNKELIKDVANRFSGWVIVGGYCDPEYFENHSKIVWFDTIKQCCGLSGKDYKPGIDYRHFVGKKTIARLSLSSGCKHHCKFCTVSDKVVELSMPEILQQTKEINKLDSELVYIDDKTFGQAENSKWLPLYAHVFAAHDKSQFDGFIIQTTANQLLKLDDKFLLTSGIRYVELGIESYNDNILKAMHKPASEDLISRATDKLRKLGIKLIPNIMIGLPGETEQTYDHTIKWLWDNIDAISHVNVYSYVDYERGGDENRVGATTLERSFADRVYRFGNHALDRGEKR